MGNHHSDELGYNELQELKYLLNNMDDESITKQQLRITKRMPKNLNGLVELISLTNALLIELYDNNFLSQYRLKYIIRISGYLLLLIKSRKEIFCLPRFWDK